MFTDHLIPLGCWQLGSEECGSAPVAILDDLHVDGPALCVERLYADVVDDEQVLLFQLDKLYELVLSLRQRSGGTTKLW